MVAKDIFFIHFGVTHRPGATTDDPPALDVGNAVLAVKKYEGFGRHDIVAEG